MVLAIAAIALPCRLTTVVPRFSVWAQSPLFPLLPSLSVGLLAVSSLSPRNCVVAAEDDDGNAGCTSSVGLDLMRKNASFHDWSLLTGDPGLFTPLSGAVPATPELEETLPPLSSSELGPMPTQSPSSAAVLRLTAVDIVVDDDDSDGA